MAAAIRFQTPRHFLSQRKSPWTWRPQRQKPMTAAIHLWLASATSLPPLCSNWPQPRYIYPCPSKPFQKCHKANKQLRMYHLLKQTPKSSRNLFPPETDIQVYIQLVQCLTKCLFPLKRLASYLLAWPYAPICSIYLSRASFKAARSSPRVTSATKRLQTCLCHFLSVLPTNITHFSCSKHHLRT